MHLNMMDYSSMDSTKKHFLTTLKFNHHKMILVFATLHLVCSSTAWFLEEKNEMGMRCEESPNVEKSRRD